MIFFKHKRGVWFAAAAVPALISGLMPALIIAVIIIALFGFGSLFSINRLFDKVMEHPLQSGLALGGIILVLNLFKGRK